MSEIPNLAGITTENLVESIGSGSFSARYINWAKTLNLLHEHAPGWLPHCVHREGGDVVFRVANSGYVQIYFCHTDETTLPPVVQAIMDNRHKAIPFDAITAVDVSNAIVRGYCKAAAVCFGLAFELWSGDSMESGYTEPDDRQVIQNAARPTVAAAQALQEKIESDPLDLWPESPFVFNADWRDVKIHFGKNEGVSLGDLSEKQLAWYCGNYRPGYDKDGGKSKFPPTDVDMALRHALTSSTQPEPVAASTDDVPF